MKTAQAQWGTLATKHHVVTILSMLHCIGYKVVRNIYIYLLTLLTKNPCEKIRKPIELIDKIIKGAHSHATVHCYTRV